MIFHFNSTGVHATRSAATPASTGPGRQGENSEGEGRAKGCSGLILNKPCSMAVFESSNKQNQKFHCFMIPFSPRSILK